MTLPEHWGADGHCVLGCKRAVPTSPLPCQQGSTLNQALHGPPVSISFVENHPGCKPGQAVGGKWGQTCATTGNSGLETQNPAQSSWQCSRRRHRQWQYPNLPKDPNQVPYYRSLRIMRFIDQMDFYSNENCKSHMRDAGASLWQAESCQVSGRKMRGTSK